MSTSNYACTARNENGARCRNNALEGSSNYYCAQHEQMRRAGKPVQKIGLPDLILLKSNVSDDWEHEWAQTLLRVGVPRVVEQTAEEKAREHAAHAEQFGRKAGTYGRVDSGVAVFGKQGLVDINLEQCFSELRTAYGGISSAQLTNGRRGNPVLVIAFSKTEKAVAIEPAVMSSLLEYFSLGSFGRVNVYANPPKNGKGIVDTVNCDFRKEVGRAKQRLTLAGGEWAND